MFPYRESSVSRQINGRSDKFTLNPVPQKRPPNHMVLSFPKEFVDYDEEKGYVPRSAKQVDAHNKYIINGLKEKAIADAALPNLVASFTMPKVPPLKADPKARNMHGRRDMECQADQDLTKLELEGLQEFQNWSTDTVEPFLKVFIIPILTLFTLAYRCDYIFLLLFLIES